MQNHNKIKMFALSTGLLLCLSAFSTAVSADYQGYWVDVVRDYQANHPRDVQPAPVSYLDTTQPAVSGMVRPAADAVPPQTLPMADYAAHNQAEYNQPYRSGY